MIEELLKNPEKYRSGPNYRATNIVFPVEFEAKHLIVKKARPMSSLINAYYAFQDKFLYGTRKLSTSKGRFQNEARKLEQLNGLHSPKLSAYGNDTLIRELIEGKEFRKCEEKKETLEKALHALDAIHQRGIVLGDAHIKNILLGDDKNAYWIDFEGVFDESDTKRAKALDLLKFVYSTYTATRDCELICHSAELVSSYSNKEVKETVKDLVSPGRGELRLWFPTRIPIDGTIKVVHSILKAYL